MSLPTSKLYWLAEARTLDGWHFVFTLYRVHEILRYASLKFVPYGGLKGAWAIKLRDWPDFQITEFTNLCDPPKEYVESLVLLAYDIKETT